MLAPVREEPKRYSMTPEAVAQQTAGRPGRRAEYREAQQRLQQSPELLGLTGFNAVTGAAR